MHGLSVAHGDSGFRRPIPTYTDPVYSLLSRGDTLWVGTAHGLFAWMPGTDQLQIAEGYRILDAANTPILGIGYVADTMVVMTPDRLVWRSPVSGGWTAGPVLSGTLGSLQAFAATNDGVWLGGPRGVGLVRPMTPPLRVLLAPSQIPDQVTAIAVRDDYLWIGTRRGLVRYLLQR
jgi:ligand-binding sensor domain-containing protein